MCASHQLEGKEHKSWLMAKVKNWVKFDELHPEITDFKVEGITHSQGLIIKFKVGFSYPLCCDITKCWTSVGYTLKNNHDMIIFCGEAEPSKPPRGKFMKGRAEEKKKKTTTTVAYKEKNTRKKKKKSVDMEINVPLDRVVEKLENIIDSIVDGLIHCKVKLEIKFRLPVMGGEHSLPVIEFEEAIVVSKVLFDPVDALLKELLKSHSMTYDAIHWILQKYSKPSRPHD